MYMAQSGERPGLYGGSHPRQGGGHERERREPVTAAAGSVNHAEILPNHALYGFFQSFVCVCVSARVSERRPFVRHWHCHCRS